MEGQSNRRGSNLSRINRMDTKERPKVQKSNHSWRRLGVFAAVAGAVTGFLLYQSRGQPRTVPAAESATSREVPTSDASLAPLSAGEALPEVSLLSLSGERLQLRAPSGSRPVLFFIFSPQCSICHETLPVWKELYEEATSRSVEVIGISVLGPSQTAAYVRQFDISWSVFCVADQTSLRSLRVPRVPVTLLMGGSGKVELALPGRIGPDGRSEILRRLRDRTG